MRPGTYIFAPSNPVAVTRVKDVYGRFHHVSTAQLADQERIMLRTYTAEGFEKRGRRVDERALPLHRENIYRKPVTQAEKIADAAYRLECSRVDLLCAFEDGKRTKAVRSDRKVRHWAKRLDSLKAQEIAA